MNDELLEQHLRGLPSPELPASWQKEILATARAVAPIRKADPVWPAILLWLRLVILRNPITSAALATLWTLITLFHATTPIDHSASAYLARIDPNRPIYLTSLPLEAQLAGLLREENPDDKPLMP